MTRTHPAPATVQRTVKPDTSHSAEPSSKETLVSSSPGTIVDPGSCHSLHSHWKAWPFSFCLVFCLVKLENTMTSREKAEVH